MIQTVYPWLRIALAMASVIACFPYPASILTAYLAVNAVEHMDVLLEYVVPSHLYNADFWRYFSLPARVLTLTAAICVTAWMFRSSTTTLNKRERLYLRITCIVIGSAIALVPAYQLPRDWFHLADATRQFIYLGMFVSWAMAIGWLRFERCVPLERPILRLGIGWVAWLGLQFLGATTGAGGLLWDLVQWEGGKSWWFGVSDISIAGQIVIAIWWLF